MSDKRSNGNTKRKLLISSDSDEDKSNEEDGGHALRHSFRIYKKKHKPEFKLPSRDDIWKDIPSVTNTLNLKKLTPRKTVNNFTKVYNDYNYDDYEDTSDDETYLDDSSSSDNETETRHRIKNYHKRVQIESSSSDDDDKRLDKCDKLCVKTSHDQDNQDKKDSADMVDELKSKHDDDKDDNMSNRLDIEQISGFEKYALEDSDESDVVSSCRRSTHQRNRSILESDEEFTQSENVLIENENKNNNNDNHNENNSTSNSSDSNDHLTESAGCRQARRKMKQRSMFQKLREARAERNKSFSET